MSAENFFWNSTWRPIDQADGVPDIASPKCPTHVWIEKEETLLLKAGRIAAVLLLLTLVGFFLTMLVTVL